MKKLIITLAAVILMALMRHKDAMAATATAPGIPDEEVTLLPVDIRTYEGESVLMTSGTPLWTAVPVTFTVDPAYKNFGYSISIDDGENFGGYTGADGGAVTLYPDDATSPTGRWQIRFRSGDEEEGWSLSDTFLVDFDCDAPGIALDDKKLIMNDEKSGISRVVIGCGGTVLAEEHFQDGNIPHDHEMEVPTPANGKTHNMIEVTCYDLAGNSSSLSFEYICDTTLPEISVEGIKNGENLPEPADLVITSSDDSDEVFTDYVIERAYNDEITTTTVSGAKDNLTIRFDEDGKYTVRMSARDGAGNLSEEVTRHFAIDTTPPELFISGVGDASDIRTAASLNIDVDDDIWEDTKVDISLTRTAMGNSEYMPKSGYNLAAAHDSRVVNISTDGEYMLEVVAKDGAGNVSKEVRRFRIDSTAPKIAVGGVNEGEACRDVPNLKFRAAEMFYESTVMTALLERKENDGYIPVKKKQIVMKSVEDHIDITPEGEGEYRLTCSASDRSGNTSEASLAFCIDHTPPVIVGLSDIDSRFFKVFSLPKKVAQMVLDRFGVSAAAFVNDNEYNDGDEILEEGKYVLSIIAEDAAGNVTEDSADFIVDHTAPQIVLSGFDKNGNIRKGSFIKVGLADNGDRLLEVRFGDRSVAVADDNTAGIAVDEYGEYDLEVKAEDSAGNITDAVIHASCFLQPPFLTGQVIKEQTVSADEAKRSGSEPDALLLVIGVISVLSGTYGLTWRSFPGKGSR